MEKSQNLKSEIAALEAERERVAQNIALVENEPLLQDRIATLWSRVSTLIGYDRETQEGIVKEPGMFQAIQREVDVLECQLGEMKGFSKKAAAHRDAIKFSGARLAAATQADAIGTSTVLVQFHETMNALGYWIENADPKVAKVEAQIAHHRRRQKDIEAEARPLKAELDDLQNKLRKLRQSREARDGWAVDVVGKVIDTFFSPGPVPDDDEPDSLPRPGRGGRSRSTTARVG